MTRKTRATILFCDLVQSSDLASFYTLANFNKLLIEFQQTGLETARTVLKKMNYKDSTFELSTGGDEIRLFLYSGSTEEDLRCAILFSLVFKLTWQCGPTNKARHREGKLPINLGIGIHQGDVIYGAHPSGRGRKNIEGYAINVAKRVEGCTREGRYFKIMVTHPIYEAAKSAMRMASFTEASAGSRLKGIADILSIYELRSYYTQEVFQFFPPNFRLDSEMAKLTRDFGKREVIHWMGPIVMRWNQLKGRHHEALQIGQKMYQLDKENVIVPAAIAKSFEAIGDFERAIYWMKNLTSSKDHQPWHFSYLGDLYSRMGNYEEAIKAWVVTLTSQDESITFEIRVRGLLESKVAAARKKLDSHKTNPQ